MLSFRKLGYPALAVLLALSVSTQVQAQPRPCLTGLVSVETEDQALHDRVCSVVERAIPALAECHLELRQHVTITFSDALEVADTACYGVYHDGSNRIDLLSATAFEGARGPSKYWSTLPVVQHYDSIIVHEMTHALIDQSARTSIQCSIDHEYIAYAMQLENLPAETRKEFISNVGASRPVFPEDLNDFIFGFSPWTFAARSWLHYSKPAKGCEFVGELLRGEKTLWFDPE